MQDSSTGSEARKSASESISIETESQSCELRAERQKSLNESDLPTVLYIETDDLTRQTVGRRLARNGVSVLTAESVEGGLTVADNVDCVSVIVLDLDLPKQNGVDTVRELRSRHPTAPIIVCGCGIPESAVSALEILNVSRKHCLCKPCRFDTLLSAIRGVAEFRRHSTIAPVRE